MSDNECNLTTTRRDTTDAVACLTRHDRCSLMSDNTHNLTSTLQFNCASCYMLLDCLAKHNTDASFTSSDILARWWNLTLVWGTQTTKVLVSKLSKLAMINSTCRSQHHARSFVMSVYILQQVVATNWLNVFSGTENRPAQCCILDTPSTTVLSTH